MVDAAIRRAIVGVTLMLFGSACASILGDFQLETDVCTAGEVRTCLCGNDVGIQRCSPQGLFRSCDCDVVCGDGRRGPSECTTASTYCDDDCCPDGIAEIDECTAGAHSCPEDCAGTGGCDDSMGCIEAFTASGTDVLCPNSPARDAFVALKKCLCNEACQRECQSTLCSGTLPVSNECQTCATDGSVCQNEVVACARE